jgi:hypothetical protein
MSWRPYLNDRLIDDRPEGFSVIVPADAPKAVPLACPVCDFLMRSHDDGAAFNAFGCCDRCARLWAWPSRPAWEAGWRPSAEQVKAAEGDRPPLSFFFDVR